MTLIEFETEYKKLFEVYPQIFGNEFKKRAIWGHISDLEKRWWVSLVNRIILSSNPKLDIQDAAAGERRAKKSVELTQDIIRASDELDSQITDRGYQEALAKFNANSLLEAVFRK